jgi:hypothetical protein
VLALLGVQQQGEGAGAHPGQLAQHDVLRHALQVVYLGVGSRVHQDIHRFLKGAPHEGTHVLPVDAVAGDGHQVALGRHDVAEQRQVTVVDIGAVEGDDVVHLPLHRLAHCLNAQYLEDLTDVVGESANGVYLLVAQHLHHAGAIRLQ